MKGNDLAQTAVEKDANSVIERQLTERLSHIEKIADTDTLVYIGPILPDIVSLIKGAVERIDSKRERLSFILETGGGYIESAERIVVIVRQHYNFVQFVIPDSAMSAGTVLAMSGNAIWMDYASMLGPIDPQVQRRGGEQGLIPALGYLEQYDRLIQKAHSGQLSHAEALYLVQNFDPAELYQYEQARELSISLLKEWLVKYKFSGWKKTRTRGKRVTQAMKTRRAGEVAKRLNDTRRWHSHSRGIPMEVIRRDLKLEIEDLGERPDLKSAVFAHHELLMHYMMVRAHNVAIHTRSSYTSF